MGDSSGQGHPTRRRADGRPVTYADLEPNHNILRTIKRYLDLEHKVVVLTHNDGFCEPDNSGKSLIQRFLDRHLGAAACSKIEVHLAHGGKSIDINSLNITVFHDDSTNVLDEIRT